MFWGKNFKFLLSLFWDTIGLEIISDDHLHVVKEKNKPSVIQILKLWFFIVAIFDFLKGLTQNHSETVSPKIFSQCISLSTPDSRVSIQPAS